MAAALLAGRLANAVETPTVTSAGLGPSGLPVPEAVVDVMAARGIDLTGHRSTTLSRPMVEAADLARCFGAELALVHVASPVSGPVAEAVLAPPARHGEEDPDAPRLLADWAREAEALAGRAVQTRLSSGRTAPEILRHAREGGFDLLVVGSHGRTGLKHLVLGSVAEELVRAAPCPVLVVRRSAAQPGAAAAD
jgi:nucleotide-binding universal stress UspA family protein